MKKLILPALAIFVFLGGVILAVLATQKKQSITGEAAVPTGPASISLVPGTSSINQNTPVSIDIKASIPSGNSVDGFQVVATISGTIPVDLNIQPATPSGMTTVLNSVTSSPSGVTLKFAYITQSPSSPFTGIETNLGKISFTAPGSGVATISFDSLLTKIVENQTSQDIVAFPVSATYTFLAATASPNPTTSAAPTSSPVGSTCTRGIQSISLTPSTQSGYRGKALTYTVTVTNNDDKNCEKANFNLSAILPFSNWSANFAQTVLSITPQSTGSTTVNFTSGTNSPYGDLPVGINSIGPKSGVVAASTYKVLAPTPTPVATTETVYLTADNALTSPSPTATESPVPSPDGYVTPEPQTIPEKISEILAGIPQNYMFAGLGAIIFLAVLWILGKIFGKKEDNNPPKITPPTEPSAPTITHGIEPPLQS